MNLQSSRLVAIGSFIAALAVILGAFGAHALRGRIGYDLFDIYQTANQYMMIHAMAILFYGIWRKTMSLDTVKAWPAVCFMLGTIIFCGSLYAITATAIRSFGAITPIGGVLFILGWLGFGFQAWKR